MQGGAKDVSGSVATSRKRTNLLLRNKPCATGSALRASLAATVILPPSMMSKWSALRRWVQTAPQLRELGHVVVVELVDALADRLSAPGRSSMKQSGNHRDN